MTAGPAVRRFLDRLKDVREVGPGRWVARCPCHEDGGRPNLNVAEGDGGAALLHCKVCDSNGAAVAAALDLPAAALFANFNPDAPRQRSNPKPKAPTIGDALHAAAALDEAAGGEGTPNLDSAVAEVIARAMGGAGNGSASQPADPSEALVAVTAWLAAHEDDEAEPPDVRPLLPYLAQLDSITYDEHRAAVAKAAGIRVGALDDAVERARPADAVCGGDGRQGAALVLADVEPWPEPVDGGELLAELARTITRFVALPDDAATAIALWILMAHSHDAAAVSALLALTSPERRCGKTTALSVVAGLVPRPVPASNISAAALFRAVEKYQPTLLIDEADTFLREREELRGLLNAGHTRSTAYAVRCDGEDFEARLFSTWAAKAIALIGRLPDTLADRSILVPMRRRAPGEDIERLRLDRLDELEPLRRRAARWALDHRDELREADPEVPTGLHDRAADNWRPLIAIAELAGGSWPARACEAAVAITGARGDEDGSIQTMLLADLRAIFDERDEDRLSSAEIVEALAEMEDRPWPEWGRERKPLTPRGLARLLGPFDVRPRQLWIDGQKTRGYERERFEDAWDRYLGGADDPEDYPAATPQGSASGRSGRIRASTAFAANAEPVGDDNPTACGIGENPRQDCILPDLPDGIPPGGPCGGVYEPDDSPDIAPESPDVTLPLDLGETSAFEGAVSEGRSNPFLTRSHRGGVRSPADQGGRPDRPTDPEVDL